MASTEDAATDPLLQENIKRNESLSNIEDDCQSQNESVNSDTISNKNEAPKIQSKSNETKQSLDDHQSVSANVETNITSSLMDTAQHHSLQSYTSLETAILQNDEILNGNNDNKLKYCNRYTVTRILLLLLCILLVFVNAVYAFGQINEMYLEEFICPQKSLKEVHQHSRSINSAKGTNEGCWASKGINIKNEILFSDSNQPYDSEYNYSTDNLIKCIIFSVFGATLFLSLLYFHLYSLCKDTFRFFNGYFAVNHEKEDSKCCSCNADCICFNKVKWILYEKIYKRFFSDDYCLWITGLICSEIFEISLQTVIFLQYNGIYIFFNSSNWRIEANKSDISLAEKPGIVILFAVFIILNCIFTGLIWIVYAINNAQYHGKTFRYLLFFIDSVFDLCYAIYPIIIALWNKNTLKTGASALNYESWINFVGALYPMTALSYRLCFGITDIIKANKTYWMEKSLQNQQDNENEAIAEIENKKDINYYINHKHCCAVMYNRKELLDPAFAARQVESLDDDNANQKVITIYSRQQRFRRFIIVLFGVMLFLFGMISLVLIVYHFIDSPRFCSNPSDDILENHSELKVWDKCIYKVYPFTFIGNDELNDIPCQCRILYIDLNQDEVKEYSDSNILTDIFANYHMLEAVKISGSTSDAFAIDFTSGSNMYTATKLRIFDVDHVHINGMNDGITDWASDLEYFRMAYCKLSTFPSSAAMSRLIELKYINLEYDLLENIDLDWLCTMKDLQYLILNGNVFKSPFPSCIYEELLSLTEIDISLNYAALDYRMFSLPKLNRFIAFGADKSNQDVYQPPFPINESFYYNPHTMYYLQGNLFCNHVKDNSTNNLSQHVISFLEETNSCTPICPGITKISEYLVCRPLSWQNGICDPLCNIPQCNFDGGDCNQLCDDECIESTISVNNNECTEECNNSECNWDFGSCIDSNTFNYTKCLMNTDCVDEWIGDLVCDDHCNVNICNFDITDCQNCDEIHAPLCHTAWQYFLTFADKPELVWYESTICSQWELLMLLTDNPMEGNCSTMIKYTDLDNSGYLNGYESVLAYMGFFQNDVKPKLFQVNCSLCLPSVSLYYYPWDYQEIMYYTKNAPDIAF